MELTWLPTRFVSRKRRRRLLITLYSRALHSRSEDPLLRDPWAEQAIDRVDYDFSKIRLSKIEPLAIAIRAKQFDTWVREWIAATRTRSSCTSDADSTAACSASTRPSTVRWFDVDYPEVIDLRRQLYPERSGYRMLGSSLLESGMARRDTR